MFQTAVALWKSSWVLISSVSESPLSARRRTRIRFPARSVSPPAAEIALTRVQRPEMLKDPGLSTAPSTETGLLLNSLTLTTTLARLTYLAVRIASRRARTSAAVRPPTWTSPTIGRSIVPLSVTRRSAESSGSSRTRMSSRSFGPIA